MGSRRRHAEADLEMANKLTCALLITGDEDMRIANIIYDNGKSLLEHYRATTGQ